VVDRAPCCGVGLRKLRVLWAQGSVCENRSTKFDVLSAWTQNGVDKIDISKSIISRIERVTNPSQISRIERVTIVPVPNLTDRTGHDCARPKIVSVPKF